MSGGNITEIIGLEFNADNRKFLINEEIRKNAKNVNFR